MPAIKRTVWISCMLLIALMTSVISVASADNFTYIDHSENKTAMLKMEAQALDCQQHDDAKIAAKISPAWEEVISSSDTESKVTHQCCPSFSSGVLSFPATHLAEQFVAQPFSLALMRDEPSEKARILTESIYKPPIG
jgi:hypothetical protein